MLIYALIRQIIDKLLTYNYIIIDNYIYTSNINKSHDHVLVSIGWSRVQIKNRIGARIGVISALDLSLLLRELRFNF